MTRMIYSTATLDSSSSRSALATCSAGTAVGDLPAQTGTRGAVEFYPADLVDEEPESPLQRRFGRLFREWKGATRFSSSITEVAMHPAYQQIIGMGKEAIPLILAELRKEPDQWFWALKAITGEDPVNPADRGRVRRMADAWIQWAEEHGYG